jgi:hypothetical protein
MTDMKKADRKTSSQPFICVPYGDDIPNGDAVMRSVP